MSQNMRMVYNNLVNPVWTKTTEMTVLPSADGWTYDGAAPEASYASVSGGILTINTTGGTTEYSQYYILSAFSGTNYTIEIKMKTTTSASTDNRCHLFIADGTYRIKIAWSTTAVSLGLLFNEGTYTIDTTAYHTYGLTRNGTNVILYVDGVEVLNIISAEATAQNQISFGDGDTASGANSNSQWDYVKYSISNVYLPNPATYDFEVNPYPYVHDEVSIENNERGANAGLVSYNKGIYHTFTLSFSNIGTAQYANFGTIFRSKLPITFYPFDEVRGTAENFSVMMVGNFSFKLSDSFYNSGYAGDIVLEQV